jgi:hypothetical protein
MSMITGIYVPIWVVFRTSLPLSALIDDSGQTVITKTLFGTLPLIKQMIGCKKHK